MADRPISYQVRSRPPEGSGAKRRPLEIPTIAVDEHVCASAIGMSVDWVRRDRRGKRIVPFYRLGGAIRYNLERVRDALDEVEEGGLQLPKPRQKVS